MNRKPAHLILCSLVITASLFSEASGQILIPRVGAVASVISAPSGSDIKSKYEFGYVAGLGYQVHLKNDISLRPEIYFIRKGGSSAMDKTEQHGGETYIYESDSRTMLNYLELPVLLTIKFGKKKNFFLSAGPSLSFGLGGTAEVDNTYLYVLDGTPMQLQKFHGEGKIRFGDAPPNTPDPANLYIDRRMDFVFHIGAGVIIDGLVMAELRYGSGLTELNSGEGNRNRAAQLTIGFPLRIKKYEE